MVLLPPPAASEQPDVGANQPRSTRAPGIRSPVTGVIALVWLGFVTMGFNTVRLGGLAVSDAFFAAGGGLILTRLLIGRTADLANHTMRRTSPLILSGSLVLLTMGTVSAFNAWNVLDSMQVVARLGWLTLVWFWILRTACRDRSVLATMFEGWRIGVLITAAVGVLTDVGVLNVVAENAEGRQTAFFDQPNEFASMLAIALPLFVLDVPGRGPKFDVRRPTLVRFGYIGLIAWGVASSGSMTGTFSAAAASIAALAAAALTRSPDASARRRSPFKPFLAVAVVTVGIFMLFTSDLPVVERFTRYQEGDAGISGSLETRDQLNSMAIEKLPETLFVGTGPQLQAATGRISTRANPEVVEGVHNMYLKVAHEAGFVALLGLLLVLLTAFNQALRLAINTRGTPLQGLSVALIGALVAAACQATVQPIVYQRYFWVTIAMTGCVWAVRRNELRTRPSPIPAG